MKWTIAEQQLLKELREKYGKNSWEKIAKDLNASNLNKIKKSGRQCRDKYINCNKFNTGNTEDPIWTQEQRKLLYQLYTKHGSSWSNFEIHFPNKSLNCIKNKFYNGIRKMACDLGNHQRKKFQDFRNPITYQNILSVLQLSNHLKRWIAQNNHQQSSKSQIFSASQQILIKSITKQAQENEQFKNYIVKQFKSLNYKLKCLGIYKTGFKKQWKLTSSRLKFVLKNDTIIESQQKYLEELTSQNENTIKQIELTYFPNLNNEELESLNLQQQQNFIKIQSLNKQIYKQNQYTIFHISQNMTKESDFN